MSDFWIEKYKFLHRLQGMVNATGEEIAKSLEGALEKVIGKTIALEAKADNSKTYSRKRKYLDQQRDEVEKVLNQVYADIGQGINSKAVEVAQAMPGMVDAMLKNGGITVELGIPHLDKKTVQAWFDSAQVDGLYFNQWLKKLESNAVARIVKETREAHVLDESLRESAKRIQNALDVGRRSAEGMAHNAFFQASNWAEREYWVENQDTLTGLRFVAELDRRTTPLCRGLDQRIFPVEQCPVPPLHWNCRSSVVPVFKWERENERIGTRIARIDTR
jgi:SPP1 gp7 family putative phage head morphogenesis protein